MGVEENKALAARWTEEIWNQGNMAAVDEMCAPNFTFNYAFPGMQSDREGYKKVVTAYRTAFHKLHLTNEIVIAEGDKVAIRWRGQSVHQGEFMGIAPTGKQVTMTGNTIARIAGDKIAEEWTEMDAVGLMQQIGAVPSSG
jgi:steroid delta-isomerase-like uncharacterized protein